ncbi:MAG: site-2 protease family protein [Deltaproteobacteria bacterium]|jgi:Zn-dependent protease|nr:site-2 protease family protein [Deltaproteobacteria bacterium]
MFDLDIQQIAITIPFLLLGLTAHEYAHAWMAYRLGDPTAAKKGRLSFNPFKHLDPVGTIVLLLTNFIGWAKPVPVDLRYFRNPARDMSLVAVAGPLANFSLAALLAIGLRLDIFWGLIFSHLPESLAQPLILMFLSGFMINLGLSIFNLLPLPPLDGFNVLSFFLPPLVADNLRRFSQLSFIVLIVLMATGALGRIIGPIFFFFGRLLLGERFKILFDLGA